MSTLVLLSPVLPCLPRLPVLCTISSLAYSGCCHCSHLFLSSFLHSSWFHASLALIVSLAWGATCQARPPPPPTTPPQPCSRPPTRGHREQPTRQFTVTGNNQVGRQWRVDFFFLCAFRERVGKLVLPNVFIPKMLQLEWSFFLSFFLSFSPITSSPYFPLVLPLFSEGGALRGSIGTHRSIIRATSCTTAIGAEIRRSGPTNGTLLCSSPIPEMGGENVLFSRAHGGLDGAWRCGGGQGWHSA